jgi:FkbM family methyltransferase
MSAYRKSRNSSLSGSPTAVDEARQLPVYGELKVVSHSSLSVTRQGDYMSVGIQATIQAHPRRGTERRYSTLESEHCPIAGFLSRAFSKAAWQVLCHIAPRRKLSVKLASGQTIRIRIGDQVSRMIFENGSYEPQLTSLLLPFIKPGMTIFDIGANIGYYTVLMARGVGPQGAVHAFEINERVLDLLEDNVRMAQLTNVTVVRRAVSKTTGKAEFFLPCDGDEAEGSLRKSTRYDAIRTVTVNTVSIDDYIREREIARVDLIKIDVEGAESEAFQGATKLLCGKVKPVIMFEALDSACVNFGVTWYEVVQQVKDFGYRIHQGDAGNFVATPL